MTESAFAILLAAAFTFGCAAIHELRRHPKELTGALALVMIVLGSFALVVAVVQTPQGGDNANVRVAVREAR